MGVGSYLTTQDMSRAKPNLGNFETPENWMPTTQTYGTKKGFMRSGAMGFLGDAANGDNDALMGFVWLAGAVGFGYLLRGWLKK